jgi:hypothetical protein
MDLDYRTESILRNGDVLADDWKIDSPDFIKQLMPECAARQDASRNRKQKLPAQKSGGRYKSLHLREDGFVAAVAARVFRDAMGTFMVKWPRVVFFER